MQMMLLFLDFDGVLHSNDAGLELNVRSGASLQSLTDEQRRYITRDGRLVVGKKLFEHANRLAAVLHPYPQIRIVITSTWREHFELETIKSFLPSVLADRVIGATQKGFVISGNGVTLRSREISKYLKDNNMENISWLALDDTSYLFFGDEENPHLFLLDGDYGFTDAAATALDERLRGLLPLP